MRRFRDLISAHKRFSFGVWIVALVAVVAGAQWHLTSGDSKTDTQVLGASAKKPPAVPTITSGPSDPTNSASATFVFKSTPTPGGYLCTLDGASSTCGSPKFYAGPLAAGPHNFQVQAQAGGFTSAPATSSWTVDLTLPAQPTITVGPDNPTIDTSAHFEFRNNDTSAVAFECRLDSSAQSCISPFDSKKVSSGDHTFSVVAIDAAGNRSGPSATWSWTVLINQAFGISGDAIGPLYPISPDVAGTPLDLRISNPYNFSITVVTIDVSVTPSAACGPTNFAVLNLLTTHPTAIVVPANRTVRLSSLPAAQSTWPADWPRVSLRETNLPQDGCQHTTYNLSYTGTATKS